MSKCGLWEKLKHSGWDDDSNFEPQVGPYWDSACHAECCKSSNNCNDEKTCFECGGEMSNDKCVFNKDLGDRCDNRWLKESPVLDYICSNKNYFDGMLQQYSSSKFKKAMKGMADCCEKSANNCDRKSDCIHHCDGEPVSLGTTRGQINLCMPPVRYGSNTPDVGC